MLDCWVQELRPKDKSRFTNSKNGMTVPQRVLSYVASGGSTNTQDGRCAACHADRSRVACSASRLPLRNSRTSIDTTPPTLATAEQYSPTAFAVYAPQRGSLQLAAVVTEQLHEPARAQFQPKWDNVCHCAEAARFWSVTKRLAGISARLWLSPAVKSAHCDTLSGLCGVPWPIGW
jgi:hypothetical protein